MKKDTDGLTVVAEANSFLEQEDREASLKDAVSTKGTRDVRTKEHLRFLLGSIEIKPTLPISHL